MYISFPSIILTKSIIAISLVLMAIYSPKSLLQLVANDYDKDVPLLQSSMVVVSSTFSLLLQVSSPLYSHIAINYVHQLSN